MKGQSSRTIRDYATLENSPQSRRELAPYGRRVSIRFYGSTAIGPYGYLISVRLLTRIPTAFDVRIVSDEHI